jgi:hypothetical protein
MGGVKVSFQTKERWIIEIPDANHSLFPFQIHNLQTAAFCRLELANGMTGKEGDIFFHPV